MLGVMNLNRVTSLLLMIVIIGCGNDSSGDGQFAVADSAHNERTIVVDGLTSPRGLVITDDGRLLVAETGGGRLI